eukprot:1289426-Amphidinium_carterae.2
MIVTPTDAAEQSPSTCRRMASSVHHWNTSKRRDVRTNCCGIARMSAVRIRHLNVMCSLMLQSRRPVHTGSLTVRHTYCCRTDFKLPMSSD